jgi:hypothetical protein
LDDSRSVKLFRKLDALPINPKNFLSCMFKLSEVSN